MSAGLALGVGLAGGLGAVARVALDEVVTEVVTARRPSAFPVGTLVANVLGSLLLGLVAGLVLDRGAPEGLQVVLGTGFCGGFTTFSTVAVASARLDRPRALLNAAATLVLTVAASAAGLAAAR